MSGLFPFNPSMAAELKRLFGRSSSNLANALDTAPDSDDDFDRNGLSQAYCPPQLRPPIQIRNAATVIKAPNGPKSESLDITKIGKAPSTRRMLRGCSVSSSAASTESPANSQDDHEIQIPRSSFTTNDKPARNNSSWDSGREMWKRKPNNKTKAHNEKSKMAAACCGFCRNNGEESRFYLSHDLRDSDGSVTCPILKKYTCPLCAATGERAHTLKYCPKNEDKTGSNYVTNGQIRTSTGRIKYKGIHNNYLF